MGGPTFHMKLSKLSTFLGQDHPGKDDTPFNQWIHGVSSSQTLYSEHVLCQAIIYSFKGDSTKYVHYMGLYAKVSNIIYRLESQY